MCGIFAIFGYQGASSESELRAFAKKLSGLLRHRGPDWSGVITFGRHTVLAHERLSIVGLSSGSQPLTSKHSSAALTVNGEIYNHQDIRDELAAGKTADGTLYSRKHDFATQSDCEVMLHLYEEIEHKASEQKEGFDAISAFAGLCLKIDGIFAFVLYDGKGDYFVARDHVGILPLYQGWAKDGSVWFSSEMKTLVGHCERIRAFPPGHFASSRKDCHSGIPIQYYRPRWYDLDFVPPSSGSSFDLSALRSSLIQAVRSQMMAEVSFGSMLSGGLDSSLVASILQEALIEQHQRMGSSSAPLQLLTFSIGLPGAPDLVAARRVAEWIKSKHYEFHFTIQEGIDMLPSVIWHLESYDVTTIRASTPMFLLSRHIKALGVKMIFSGEGSDEIFGGYLYFHAAPSAAALHKESVIRVQNLHLSDCLRANKATMAWGVEARVPFLDRSFLDASMMMDPAEKLSSKQRIEKSVLRRAFDLDSQALGKAYLPRDILWRQKEQFSDGVGYSWIDSLKEYTEGQVSDERMAAASEIFPVDPPTTKEAFFYREIFEQLFPGTAAASTVKRWIPRADWGCPSDPSGRAQRVHQSAF